MCICYEEIFSWVYKLNGWGQQRFDKEQIFLLKSIPLSQKNIKSSKTFTIFKIKSYSGVQIIPFTFIERSSF